MSPRRLYSVHACIGCTRIDGYTLWALKAHGIMYCEKPEACRLQCRTGQYRVSCSVEVCHINHSARVLLGY